VSARDLRFLGLTLPGGPDANGKALMHLGTPKGLVRYVELDEQELATLIGKAAGILGHKAKGRARERG
jgi:hypothetical protein